MSWVFATLTLGSLLGLLVLQRNSGLASHYAAALCVAVYWTIGSPFNWYLTITRWWIAFREAWVQRGLVALAVENAGFLVFAVGGLWLFLRSSEALSKPIKDLISKLGIDVPEKPEPTIAGIASDSATITWQPATDNKPLPQYFIEVNGVRLACQATRDGNRPVITINGLLPDRFYNVRVVAVGTNEYRNPSRNLRIKTLPGKASVVTTGKAANHGPRRDDILPIAEIEHAQSQDQSSDEESQPRIRSPTEPRPTLVATSLSDSPSATRDVLSPLPGSRRNTLIRRHSPSSASTVDSRPTRRNESEVQELGDAFGNMRQEQDELLTSLSKEEDDTKRQLEGFEKEKQVRRGEQKKKEESTEKLKKETSTTERTMRSMMQQKAQRDKNLKSKQTNRSHLQGSVKQWQEEIDGWDQDEGRSRSRKQQVRREGPTKVAGTRKQRDYAQTECSDLEGHLKAQRDNVKHLEEDVGTTSTADEDAAWQDFQGAARNEWQHKHDNVRRRLHEVHKRMHHQDGYYSTVRQHAPQYPQSIPESYAQNNTSGLDLPSASPLSYKRRSRNGSSLSGNMMSPNDLFATPEQASQLSVNASTRHPPPGLGFNPYQNLGMQSSDQLDQSACNILTLGAPLSPSAVALLPNGLFDAEDQDQTQSQHQDRLINTALMPNHFSLETTNMPNFDQDPQSPASGKSKSILSSPQSSTYNLPYSHFTRDDGERQSLRSFNGSFGPPPPSKLTSFLNFRRGNKVLEEGPALGSLKHGQSQSFPRQADDAEALASKRRISLSGWSMFNRAPAVPDLVEDSSSSGSKAFSARNLLPFGARRLPGIADDASSPRPVSIASSSGARPSTDSGSIWGPQDIPFPKQRHIWINDNLPWSRNPSRRPSIHGSPSMLKTNLADADDEILGVDDLLDPQVSPSQVGVIGSKKPASKSLAKTLNPAAPTFSIFRSKADKEKDKDKTTKDKIEAKDKSKKKDKKEKEKAKQQRALTPDPPRTASGTESLSEPRMSRDGFSVHTGTSLSESRDSLSLDYAASSNFSDAATPPLSSGKDGAGSINGVEDTVMRKLFRKASSTRFVRSGKRGPPSIANSDRNDRASIGDVDELLATPNAEESQTGSRATDSATGSPLLGSGGKNANGGTKEGRMSGRWFGKKKKGAATPAKERESLDMSRAKVSTELGDEDVEVG